MFAELMANIFDVGWCGKQSYESIKIRNEETEEGDGSSIGRQMAHWKRRPI